MRGGEDENEDEDEGLMSEKARRIGDERQARAEGKRRTRCEQERLVSLSGSY